MNISGIQWGVILLFFSITTSAQDMLLKQASVNKSSLQLNEFLLDYEVISWDGKALKNNSENLYRQIQLEVDGEVLILDVVEEDLYAKGGKARILTTSGEVLENLPPRTYFKGNINGIPDSKVSIISNEGFFFGVIQSNDERFYIKPANKYNPYLDPSLLVMFNEKNELDNPFPASCGVEIEVSDKNEDDLQNLNSSPLACYGVNLGIVADYLYFNSRGSVQNVIDDISAIVVSVNTDYDSDYFTNSVTYYISEFVISTCEVCDLWTSSTSSSSLLSDFASWGGMSGFNASTDINSFWTGRNFNGSTVGLAYTGSGLICGNFAYNVLEDFSTNPGQLRVLASHEMGHNWNAGHDGSGSNTIMAPSVTTSTIWSATSQSSINPQISSAASSCLGSCSGPGCQQLEEVVVSSVTSTGFTIGWNTTGAGNYRIRVRDLSDNNIIYNSATTSNLLTINPTGFEICKEYKVMVENNCSGTYSLPVSVIIAKEDQGCSFFSAINTVDWNSVNVQFFDETINASSRLWDFGDGMTSSELNPIHTYDDIGHYDVSLSVNNGNHIATKNSLVQVLPHKSTPYTPAGGGNFENEDFGCENLIGTESLWERGVPSNYFSSSGSAWVTKLDGDIPPQDNMSALYSPSFDFSQAGTYTLSFDLGMETLYSNAPFALQVQYSTDGGNNWSRLGSSEDNDWYNRGPGQNGSIHPAVFSDGMGFLYSSNSINWSYDVSFLSGASKNSNLIFRFLFNVAGGFSINGYQRAGAMVDNFRITFDGVVPVELTSFTAKEKNRQSWLNWQTEGEVNNESFQVLHSTDGIRYSEIGWIQGAGTTEHLQHYDFVHVLPEQGENFYQLQQNDFDGNSKIFGPVKVHIEAINAYVVYPNPVRHGHLLHVSGIDGSNKHTISVVNSNGKIVFTANTDRKRNQQVIDISNLPNGIYILLIDGEMVERVVKL